ncbi:MAG: hypothetical protein IT280_02480 [Ignavibacteria bacterium]|nr:hypothetical protein [Ignavibacteria bacterium]
MKKILLLLIILNCSVFTQGGWEILINNYTTHNNTINVKIYPVSMIFNGVDGYNLLAHRKNLSNIWQYYYLSGVAWDPDEPNPSLRKKTFYTLNQGEEISLNADEDISGNECDLGFGLGKYRVDVWWNNNILTQPPDESFTIEYDAGYLPLSGNFSADLSIWFIDNTNLPNNEDPRMVFHWLPTDTQSVRVCNYKIEAWNQYENGVRLKEFGNFHYGNGTTLTPNNYTIIPQDPRRDCVNEIYPQYSTQNHLFNFAYTINYIDYYSPSNIGVLTLNLTIEKDVSTPDILTYQMGYPEYPCVLPSPIVITEEATLKLAKGNNNTERILNFRQYTDYNDGTDLLINTNGTFLMESSPNNPSQRTRVILNRYCNVEVSQNGWLTMGSNSVITMNSGSSMYWFPNSHIYGTGNLSSVSKIEIKTGAIIRNCGAVIHEPLNRSIEGGEYKLLDPLTCWSQNGPLSIEHIIDSGGSINITQEGILSIEKNCKLIFDGTESHLSAEPGTSIILGAGASIEFRNGAYLDADGCTFTSINSGEIWQGIVLDEAGSQSNIRNCTFNDAAASIEVSNSVCSITGNTFNISNDPSCHYGINAINETNITIKVYDILGNEVFSFNEYKLAGSYEVRFDGTNLASGMYLYSLEANG